MIKDSSFDITHFRPVTTRSIKDVSLFAILVDRDKFALPERECAELNTLRNSLTAGYTSSTPTPLASVQFRSAIAAA